MLLFITSSHFLKIVFLNVVGVRPQDNKVLKDRGLWDELFGGKFGSLPLAYKDRCIMGLETSNLLRSSSLSNCINGDTNTDLGLDRFHVFVDSKQHAGVDGQSQVVQEVVVLASDESFHISSSVEDSEEAGKRNIGEEQLV